jgi:hypothetical protein
LALDCANAKLRILQSTGSDLADGANAAYSSRHLCTLRSELLNGSWSVLAVFPRHLWAVALQSDHAGADTDYGIVTNLSLAVCKVLVATGSDTSLVTLVRKSTTHHRLLRRTLANHMVAHVTTHGHTIIFDNSNATRALKM